jgi:hypothetical protein
MLLAVAIDGLHTRNVVNLTSRRTWVRRRIIELGGFPSLIDIVLNLRWRATAYRQAHKHRKNQTLFHKPELLLAIISWSIFLDINNTTNGAKVKGHTELLTLIGTQKMCFIFFKIPF